MPLIKTNNIDIHYIFLNEELLTNKSKPLLVFLHEGLGSIVQWKDFPLKLATELELPALIYDRYGYGLSSPLKEERNVDYLHVEAWNYLPNLLHKLIISNQLILIGHSDGGSIALLFAARYPGLVSAVITFAAHVIFEEFSRIGIEKAIINYQEFDLKKLLEKFHGSATDSMFYGWADIWTSTEFSNWDIRNELKTIKCPTLAIQGEDDEYGSDLQLRYISESVSGKHEKLLIPKCGHIPHLQRQDIVLPFLIDFINGLCFH